ncbi:MULTISPECIES: hypothetical protein [Enterobacteriaceae]|uniref:hypothetical protein n=1 Tax=Enterobacteriaceae TaxID=543 RepID=UPI0005CDAC3A|nr:MULTISPECIES: hypothetical protein [Enterobacteriaceae]SAE35133.1 Uncharacterised protein [Enterobacter cloacae]EKS6456825.1 hypothetical protein [Enterobacter hormaechei]ELC6372731.1 hypothetical protein [Enterobacter hormaechei]ELC6480455.1 hypothetical protein [Enterobacter hormaechei]ELC6576987.1 hypothetical protein [Enterobacter hormaechei]
MTKKKIKDGISVIVDAAVTTITNPMGTAKIVSGYSTLKSGYDAGVTTDQMKAMFPDLQKFSNANIEGFVEIGSSLASGQTTVVSSIIQGPAGDPVKS